MYRRSGLEGKLGDEQTELHGLGPQEGHKGLVVTAASPAFLQNWWRFALLRLSTPRGSVRRATLAVMLAILEYFKQFLNQLAVAGGGNHGIHAIAELH